MGPVLWKKTFYLHKAIKNCKFLKNLTKKMIQMIKKNNIKAGKAVGFINQNISNN